MHTNLSNCSTGFEAGLKIEFYNLAPPRFAKWLIVTLRYGVPNKILRKTIVEQPTFLSGVEAISPSPALANFLNKYLP